MMTQRKKTLLNPQQITALRGLRLPMQVVSRLRQAGIYCEPAVSIEYRQGTKKYVLRGRESGGATAQVGAYCCFVDPRGNAFSWLEPVSSVGRNSIHAIVIEPELVRIHACRDESTYALLITRHQLRRHDDTIANVQHSKIRFCFTVSTEHLRSNSGERIVSSADRSCPFSIRRAVINSFCPQVLSKRPTKS